MQHVIAKIILIFDMKYRIKLFKSLFIILTLISLSAFIKEKDLSGFYYTEDCMYNLTLSNDSSFKFNYRIGYKKSISTGTWRTIGKKWLILKSTYKDLLNTPVKVFESKSQNGNDSLFFKINAKFVDDSKCSYVIIINDSIEVLSNRTSVQSQAFGKIEKLKLKYACPNYTGVPYPIRDIIGTEEYMVKDSTTNVYEFNWDVDDELFYYEVFDNDTIDIKNKYLYFRRNIAKLIKRK